MMHHYLNSARDCCLLAMAVLCLGAQGISHAAISIDFNASRNGGVGPLAVHFDATATASDQTDRPFHELHYRWDFGDPGAGDWPSTGRPRNQAEGPVAAHVFEYPGQYTVTLIVSEPGGVSASAQTVITVQDPDVVFADSTYYVSSTNGNDGNSGTSPEQAFQTVAHARQFASNARLLFRRGDTFFLPVGLETAGHGPGIIGAYGSGPRPVFQAENPSVRHQVWIRHNDWRVVDIRIIGTTPQVSGPDHVGLDVTSSRVLVSDVEISEVLTGLGSNDGTGNEELFFVNNHVRDIGNMGAYLSGYRNAFMGNRIERAWASHLLRVVYANRWVISHNELEEPSYQQLAQGRLALKFHAQGNHHGPPGEASELSVISANTFRGSRVSVVLGPQDGISDHHVRDILVEGNLFLPDVMTQSFLELIGRDFTVRNNIFLIDRAIQYAYFVVVKNWSVITQPQRRYEIYNNAGIWHEPPVESYHILTMVQVEDGAEDVRVHNNVLWRDNPAGASDVMIWLDSDQLLGQVQASHNFRHDRSSQWGRIGHGGDTQFYTLEQWQAQGLDQNSMRGDPSWSWLAGGEYDLSPGSPLIDAGAPVPLLVDYYGNPRPVGPNSGGSAQYDIGPVEYQHTFIFRDRFEAAMITPSQ